jgi:hypothetical protein
MYRLRFAAFISLMALAGALVIGCTGSASLPAATSGPAGQPAAEAPDEQGDQPANLIPDQALIVYTGTLELEVSDLRAAVDQGQQLIAGLGGHVAASHEQNSADSQTATVTYRIPADRWTEALAGLRALGERVVGEQTESEDVTAAVVDLDARITNLRATEGALQAIMERATTIADVLKVQQELTTVRGEIESKTAQRDVLAQRAALATLEVNYGVPLAKTSIASEGWDLGSEVDGAVATLVRIGQWTASLLVWLAIVIVPVVLPAAAVVYLVIRIRRRWLATHPSREAMTPPYGPSV